MNKQNVKSKTVKTLLSNLEEILVKYELKSIIIKDIQHVFEYKDIYLQLYLLCNAHNSFSSKFGKKIVDKLIKLIKALKEHMIIDINLDGIILDFIKCYIDNFESIKDIISILSCIQVEEKDLVFFRKHFGYNMIYREYLNILKDHDTSNLHIILRLLKNNKICYNRLLDVYKQLNKYLQDRILDNNFIFCCNVLYNLLLYDNYQDSLERYKLYNQDKSDININTHSFKQEIQSESEHFTESETIVNDIIRNQTDNRDMKLISSSDGEIPENSYDKSTLKDNSSNSSDDLSQTASKQHIKNESFGLLNDDLKEFFLGFNIYLFEIITNIDNYKNFTLPDIQILVNLIRLTYPLFKDNYKLGLLSKCTNVMLKLFTNIYEDTIILTFLLQILDILIIKSPNVLKVHDQLDSFVISSFNSYSEYEFIIRKFLEYKYKVLDKIKVIYSFDYNKVYLYNDLFNNEKYCRIILNNTSLLSLDFIIDNLIILVNNSTNKLQYIDILFRTEKEDNKHPGNRSYTSYWYLYLISLKDNYKDILYFIVYYTNMNIGENKKYFELLVMMYFKYIEIENVYTVKSRVYLLKKILEYIKEEYCVDYIMKEMKKSPRNKNIFLLIYLIVDKQVSLTDKQVLYFYKYLIEDISSIKVDNRNEKDTTISDIMLEDGDRSVNITGDDCIEYYMFSTKMNIDNLYINTCVDLLLNHESKLVLKEVCCMEANYYNILAVLIYCKVTGKSTELIKDKIFDFVFKCKGRERKEIYKLIKEENLGNRDINQSIEYLKIKDNKVDSRYLRRYKKRDLKEIKYKNDTKG